VVSERPDAAVATAALRAWRLTTLASNSVLIANSTVFLFAFFITVLLTPVVRRYALRWKLGDKPNGRKIHTHVIPHLGGIAIVLGTVAGMLALNATTLASDAWVVLMWKMLPPVALIVILGLVDDMKSLGALQKLTVQVMSSLILAVSGFMLFTGIPALDGANSIVLLVSVAFMVGISSSVNLIDGHDGLAAGVCLISAAAFAAMAVMLGAGMALVVTLAISGACLGFLVFNFPPGKIFMGDTGSMFLGIMLALVACTLTAVKPEGRTFIAICFVLGIPMLDAFLAITRRLILRLPVFKADCLHMHHVLRELSFSPRQILLVLYSKQVFLSGLGLLVLKGYVFPIVIGLAFTAVVFVSYLRIMVLSRSTIPSTPSLSANTITPLKGNMPRQKASIGR
jgi:UDP-GlcNAc:undecaprenyl-phosphate GlcNAc-1-phosphate transferase